MLIKKAITKTIVTLLLLFALVGIVYAVKIITWYWLAIICGFILFVVYRWLAIQYYRYVRDRQDLTTMEGRIICNRMNRNINWLNGYFSRAINGSR